MIPIGAVLVILLAMIIGLFFLGIDRKIAARFQSRIGPPVIQPFRDLVKLLTKETIIPDNAVRWLFSLAPVAALTSALLLILYLPFLGVAPILSGYGDLILVLYLLMLPALSIAIGGLASGNNYATVGSQRKLIMMLSYEFPLAVLVMAIVWRTSRMSLDLPGFSFATFAQHPILTLVGPVGVVGVILLAITILIALCAELIKGPFDNPEAETELAGGILVDYSGRNLALFLLSDAVKLCAFITLIIGLLLPCSLGDMFSSFTYSGWIAIASNVAFFFVKFTVIALLGLTFVRVAFTRLKITQVTRFFWLVSGGISLIGLLLIFLDSMM
ncbi:MAG: complex I subunit 1 family protein [Candidatus Woesearchaeota archaeon]